jgi:trigger factor
MKCKKCGEKKEKDFEFCAGCGEKAKPSSKKALSALATVALLAIAIVVAVVVINIRNAEYDSEVYYEEEYIEEEAEEPVEEEVEEALEEIEIPEGALANDYIIIHQHRGLVLTAIEIPQITDDDVERTIETELAEQEISVDITDRPAEEGDIVTIDFAGSVDGEYFEGGTSEGFDLILGSGTFIGPYGDYEGFEEQIIGHNVGDNFDIVIQFPADYHEELAEVVANFNITLHAITETIIPEFTDEWVQENSLESTTVEEYRQEIREELNEVNRINELFMRQMEAFEALMEHVVVINIPDWVIEEEVAIQMSFYRNLVAAEGMEFEEFLQLMGTDEMSFNQEVLSFAEVEAPRNLAISLIMESENLEITPEEKMERIEEIARASGIGSAQEYITVVGEEYANSMARQLRVAEFLVEHAIIL